MKKKLASWLAQMAGWYYKEKIMLIKSTQQASTSTFEKKIKHEHDENDDSSN